MKVDTNTKVFLQCPVELRNTAYLISVNSAPDAVNAIPIADIVNFYLFS